jgi:DNA-binding XRE family transcriptional regulator
MSMSNEEEIYLKKNLRYLREQHETKLSQTRLADTVGVTRSAISSYEDGRAEPKLQVLNAIADFFKITVDQLLNIDLARLQDHELQQRDKQDKYTQGSHLRVLSITVDGNDSEQVVLVPERAAAGYATSGYANPEYLVNLPKYGLPFLSKGRTHRAFEVSGDSMLPLQSGSVVIGAYVENFKDVKEGQVCVVVTEEGPVLKKVHNRIEERGTLLLKSSNVLYGPYEVRVEEVRELWAFVAYISRGFPEEQTSAQELRGAFDRLEEEVRQIKHRLDD